jgi:copper chaperone CopZ
VGCVTAVRRALEKVPGVGEIAIKPGDPDFVVHYDSKKVTKEQIVAALIAGGEKDARVKA